MPAKTSPYQPLLLRLLHGATGVATILALITAYWTYDTYDGRWGHFLPKFPQIEGIHGTFGLYSLLLLPLLIVYACHRGARRLMNRTAIAKLTQLDRPIGWYSWHQLINTLSILALAFAVMSGKMMGEHWLPRGELDHAWYIAHLLSWVILLVCLFAHVLAVLKVGGMPLLWSVWRWQHRSQDSPAKWPAQIRQWWQSLGATVGGVFRSEWGKLTIELQLLEITVLASVVFGWIASSLD